MPLVLLILACKDDEVTWTQYNSTEDTVTVEVGAADLLPAVSTPLRSNTGEVQVGVGSVDPGGGPIGTQHTFRVELDAAYVDAVDRATVRTSSGERGEDEYTLTADSAGEGLWVFTLESVGEEGESRSDIVTFRLWTQDGGDTGSGE